MNAIFNDDFDLYDSLGDPVDEHKLFARRICAFENSYPPVIPPYPLDPATSTGIGLCEDVEGPDEDKETAIGSQESALIEEDSLRSQLDGMGKETSSARRKARTQMPRSFTKRPTRSREPKL
jgi:hypothetical protein